MQYSVSVWSFITFTQSKANYVLLFPTITVFLNMSDRYVKINSKLKVCFSSPVNFVFFNVPALSDSISLKSEDLLVDPDLAGGVKAWPCQEAGPEFDARLLMMMKGLLTC